MFNFKKKISDSISNSKTAVQHQAESLGKNLKEGAKNLKEGAENLNKNIKEGAENLNKNIGESAETVVKTLERPAEYNYLIFALPIVLILLAFIPMAPWLMQVVRFVIFCCMGYVLFFEYRESKKRDRVFFISLALTVLFNPLIPFYVPGMPINIISIVAIGYLAYLTQMSKSHAAHHTRTKKK